jgi:hypothetical protein
MAKPLSMDIKVPLQSEGWVRFTVHIDDIEDTASEEVPGDRPRPR